jgi:hypothetical protein
VHKPFFEGVGDRLLDDESFGGDAALSVVLVASPARTVFFSALPADSATSAPALSEPVNVTPAKR